MKNLLAITLIFFLCSQLVLNSSENVDKVNEDTKKKSKSLRSVKKNVKKVISSTKVENLTEQAKPKDINSLGHEVEGVMIVDKPPFKLDRCDQIVAFESEFIPDFDDFTQRKKAYFTLTAYHFNKFEVKDVNKLEQSIVLASSRSKPTEPQGAQFCLIVDGGDYEKPIIFCAKDENEKLIFLSLFETFEDCRAGKMIGKGSLTVNNTNAKPDGPGLGDIQKSCGFDGPMPSPDSIIGALEQQKQDEKVQDSGEFWIPGGHKVPGTPDEDDKKKKK